MRHKVKTKKFRGTSAHRDSMLKNLAASLIKYESITTTEAKARAVIPLVERVITLAKKENQASERIVESMLPVGDEAEKVVKVLVPRYKKRQSGFIKKLRLGKRPGDDSRMIKISLFPEEEKQEKKKKKVKSKKAK